MNYKKIIAALTVGVMCFGFAGCELVSLNDEKDKAQIVLQVGDETFTKEEVEAEALSQGSLYGLEDINSKDYDEYRVEVLQSMAQSEAVKLYAIENGYMDKITEEDQATLDESYNTFKENYDTGIIDQVYTENGVPTDDTATDEQKGQMEPLIEEARQELLKDYDIESVEEYATVLKEDKAVEIFNNEILDAVVISDEAAQAEYDAKLQEQIDTYTETPSAYNDDVTAGTETILYAPEGYRRVKHILVAFTEEDETEITRLEGEITAAGEGSETAIALQAELDTYKANALANIQGEAQGILDRVNAGEDFDALSTELNDDPGAETNPEGYLVHESMTTYDTAFQEAAMALSAIGEVSGLVETSFGYHIMLYASDVPSGAVDAATALEDIKADLKSTEGTTQQTKRYTEIYDTYLNEGKVVLYEDRILYKGVPGDNN